MTSEEYIEENPRITEAEARRILNQHDGEPWDLDTRTLDFFHASEDFENATFAKRGKDGLYSSEDVLGWLGY